MEMSTSQLILWLVAIGSGVGALFNAFKWIYLRRKQRRHPDLDLRDEQKDALFSWFKWTGAIGFIWLCIMLRPDLFIE